MANMSVTYEELNDKAKQIDLGKSDIQSTLAQLQAMVEDLTASGFVTDQASGAFKASYEQFTQGLKQASDAMDGMSGFLTRAGETLADVDQQLAAGISR